MYCNVMNQHKLCKIPAVCYGLFSLHPAAHLYREQMTGAAESGKSARGMGPMLSSCRTLTASALLLLLLLLTSSSAAASLERRLSGCFASSRAVMVCCLPATCRTRLVLAPMRRSSICQCWPLTAREAHSAATDPFVGYDGSTLQRMRVNRSVDQPRGRTAACRSAC